jgi:hypothetical protein
LLVGNGGTGLSSLTANSVLLGNGSSTIQFVSPGSSGNVLTSNGTTWSSSAPSGGGSAMTLISTLTASNSATLAWTGLSGYSKYLLIFQNMIPATNNERLYLQFGTGAGPTYITSSYHWSVQAIGQSSSSNAGGASISQLGISSSILNSGTGLSGFAHITGMNSGSYAAVNFHDFYVPSIVSSVTYVGGGTQNSDTNAKTAIQIYMDSGNITSGTASLYGISS